MNQWTLLKLRRPILAFLVVFITPALFAQPIIGEFRLRGPSGANDEYIEIYNNSSSNLTVTSSSGTGYGIAASDGTLRCTIPNGLIIPARGHFLCANSVAYSLGAYATADATFTTDIPDNAGIALFSTNIPANFAVATRLDAVGSASEANSLYREGTGYPAITPFSIDYAFVRDQCGKQGSITNNAPCTSGGLLLDSDNNATDFIFVDTNGTSAGAGQRLGAPGPEALASPIYGTNAIATGPVDTCSAQTTLPNYARDLTSAPAQNSTFGTVDIRGTFTNNTGSPLTVLRFRVIDLTTFPAPTGFADLRPLTSTSTSVTVDRPPCGSGTSSITVQGTTLEQPPNQPNGGGFNSSLRVTTVNAGTPLANGASVDVRFVMGVQQNGAFRFAVVPEGYPVGGNSIFAVSGSTYPFVVSSTRVDADPAAQSSSVSFLVTFSEPVTGVDSTDFTLTNTGAVAGAAITGVAGSGATRTVTINTGTGNGTVRLDVVDDNSIVDGSNQLGGPTSGDGNFTTGQFYTLTAPPPTVSSITRGSTNPTPAGSTVMYTVTFSETVSGVDVSDFALTTTGSVSGATVTNVTGSGATRTVTVTTGTGTGTLRLDLIDNDSITNGATVPLGGTGAGNGSFTAGEVYTLVAAVPALDSRSLILLGCFLAAVGLIVTKRT